MSLPEEGAVLIEERDWGLPWPEFDVKEDCDYNLRVFELSRLTLPDNAAQREEYEKLMKLEESKEMVRKLFARRKRNIRIMIKILFKHNTAEMSRSAYNLYVRFLASVVTHFGYSAVDSLSVRIALYCIAHTFPFVFRL